MIRAGATDPWGRDLSGRRHELTLDSKLLAGNPLGDPASRPLVVYTPPGWPDAGPYPVVFALQGFTGQVDMWQNRTAFLPTLVEAVDALVARGDVPPFVLALPDCWTTYGGSQFQDSAGTGRYQSYLCDEVVPFVEARFHTRPDRRGVTGKSSGGYGALVVPLQRPGVFHALASIAGDSAFEYCYQPDFPLAWRALRKFDFSVERFWLDLRTKTRPDQSDHDALNVVAMAACYSPRADGEPDLPFDGDGMLRDDVMARWLALDPVRLFPQSLPELRALRAIHVECGLRDEYRLYVGAQRLHAELSAAAITHTFELFDGGHGNLQHRSVAAIAALARVLAE